MSLGGERTLPALTQLFLGLGAPLHIKPSYRTNEPEYANMALRLNAKCWASGLVLAYMSLQYVDLYRGTVMLSLLLSSQADSHQSVNVLWTRLLLCSYSYTVVVMQLQLHGCCGYKGPLELLKEAVTPQP